MTITAAALLSLLSAIIVAVLSHVFSIKRKRTDELFEMRIKAYVDFINAASRLVAARRKGRTEDELEELVALNDAKTRICICAEPNIVKELTQFWNAGGTLEKEQEILAFTRLCLQMRESLGNKRNDIVSFDISDTLFKLEPSNYSFRAGNGE